VLESQFDDLDAVVDGWAEQAAPLVAALTNADSKPT
jgi:hypothetical protein